MKGIRVLDCTLRDGGYVNNWQFSNTQIQSIIGSLEDAHIEIIECGYLNDSQGKGFDTTLFQDVDSYMKVVGAIETQAQKVVMINFGDFDISHLPPKNTNTIDGIRLAFHKKDLQEVFVYAQKVIELGYTLYFQPMVTKNYSDLEFLSLIEKVNQLGVYSFYIVDSFGSMTLQEFQKYMILADSNLKQTIALGYHSHNNMQLAFSNAIMMCSMNLQREILIDASIYGIGRGAGNLNTELITDYLNTTLQKSYNTLPLLEIIDKFLYSLMQKNSWGFSPAQYLSASLNCHPNYATYLINKNTNHIVGVKKVLERLPYESRNSFDEILIEKLYREFLLETKTPVTQKFIPPASKQIFLLASGKSVQKYTDTIQEMVYSQKYCTIALNHKPSFEVDYYFFSNQKRYDEFASVLLEEKTIVTSNIALKKSVAYVLDIEQLVHIDDLFVTNVAMVMMHYLLLLGIQKIAIAGLDGYKINEDNYNYNETNVITNQEELQQQNEILKRSLHYFTRKIEVNFITPTTLQ